MKLEGSPFLILDLRLYVVDGVGGLHLEGDSLPCEGLDEYLHLVVHSRAMRYSGCCRVVDVRLLGYPVALKLYFQPVQF